MLRIQSPLPTPSVTMARLGALVGALFAVLTLVATSAGSAFAADDPDLFKRGERAYRSLCRACHLLDRPANRVGPHLVNILGRRAASIEGFVFSEELKQSGLVWTEETLAAFLADGQALVPGNKMISVGVHNAETMSALIYYMKSAGANQAR